MAAWLREGYRELEEMNWVARRKLCEDNLADGLQPLWASVRSAISDACDTFNAHYGRDSNPKVECTLDNGKRVIVTRPVLIGDPTASKRAKGEILVSFDEERHSIFVVRTNAGSAKIAFVIEADEKGAYLKQENGATLDADDISERVLKPLLFPS